MDFKEAMKLVAAGEKVRLHHWHKKAYLEEDDGVVMMCNDKWREESFYVLQPQEALLDTWEVYKGK